MQQDQTVRLDKYLSNAGVISRRGVKTFLKEHSVIVNGKRLTQSGERIGVSQQVLIDGKKVTKAGYVYYLLNKPIGVVSTTSDEFDRETVTSLIDTTKRIYPVGRLDKDSHGLVLLTNDGALTHQLIHPRYHVPKVYRIVLSGHPREEQLNQLRQGVILDDGITLPATVTVVRKTPQKTTLEITLHEGRNRQIRRMCETLSLELLDLQRIAFGPLKLGTLKEGEYRELTKKETQLLGNAIRQQ